MVRTTTAAALSDPTNERLTFEPLLAQSIAPRFYLKATRADERPPQADPNPWCRLAVEPQRGDLS
jgi:hypothetical protein